MDKVIGEIKKTNNVKTMVRLTEFKGRNFLDIRDFFKGKEATDFGPTKKGICLDISRIGDIISLMEQAEAFVVQSTKK